MFGRRVSSRHAKATFVIAVCMVIATGHVSTAQWIDVKTYAAPYGTATAITAGPDGALWFLGPETNTIGRITTTGEMTQYVVPNANTYLNDIASGPDGALWFTAASAIGRITTAGLITEFPVGFGSSPHSLSWGPDGALWFTDTGTDSIGRMTTDGTITHFALPPGSFPGGIVTGPDGALWFTEEGTERIGRITTSGNVTHYQLPPLTNPGWISVGPDDALWVSSGFAGPNVIWRITTSGVITPIPLPSSAFESTIGADGSLWVASWTAVIRITPGGVITRYPVDEPGIPRYAVQIASGPDAGLWFTGHVDVKRVPACGLGLRAGFADTTLYAKFDLSTTVPATFRVGYFSQNGQTGLHSRSIDAVVPPASFTVAWGPGFPDEGEIEFAAALKDRATDEFLCAEWQTVNTSVP